MTEEKKIDPIEMIRSKVHESETDSLRRLTIKETHVAIEKTFEDWVLKTKRELDGEVSRGRRSVAYADAAVDWLSKSLGVMSMMSTKAETDYAKALGKLEGFAISLGILLNAKVEPESDVKQKKERNSRKRPEPGNVLGANAADLKTRRKKKTTESDQTS